MKLDSKQNDRRAEFPRSNSFLNSYGPIQHHKHRLPHWQQGSVFYFVTWRLADSLPAEKLARWDEKKHLWFQKHPPPWSAQIESEYEEQFRVSSTIGWTPVKELAC